MLFSDIFSVILFAAITASVGAQRVPRPSAAALPPAPADVPEDAPFAYRGRKQEETLVPLRQSPNERPLPPPSNVGSPVARPAPTYFAVTPAPVYQPQPLIPTLFPLHPSIAALFGLQPSPVVGAFGAPTLRAPSAPAPALAPQGTQAAAPGYVAQQPSSGFGVPAASQQGVQSPIYVDQQAQAAPISAAVPPTLLPPLAFPSLSQLFGLPDSVGGGLLAPAPYIAPAATSGARAVALGSPIVSASQVSGPVPPPQVDPTPVAQREVQQNAVYVDQQQNAVNPNQQQQNVVYENQAVPTFPPPLFTLPPFFAALFGIPTADGNNAQAAAPLNAAPVSAVQQGPSVQSAPFVPSGQSAASVPSAPASPVAFGAPILQLPQFPLALPSLFPAPAAPVPVGAKTKAS